MHSTEFMPVYSINHCSMALYMYIHLLAISFSGYTEGQSVGLVRRYECIGVSTYLKHLLHRQCIMLHMQIILCKYKPGNNYTVQLVCKD